MTGQIRMPHSNIRIIGKTHLYPGWLPAPGVQRWLEGGAAERAVDRDASWVIVENRDIHLGDAELRQMTGSEWEQLHAALPDWVEE